MSKKRVFISFDYDHDSDIKLLLAGQARNPDSPFEFSDASIKEHLTGEWKNKVSRRLDNVDVVIILCGEHTHMAHGVNAELEITQEKKKPYFLLSGYSEGAITKPKSAKSDDKLYKWAWENLKLLIDGKR